MMIQGDIDNKPSPAVVIDIDGLIVDAPKTSALSRFAKLFIGDLKAIEIEVDSYTLHTELYPLLESLFYQDISIYFFAHRPHNYKPALLKLLEEFPYTRLYVGGIKEREALLRSRHVHWYFYSTPEHGSMLSKDKEKFIKHWSDISL